MSQITIFDTASITGDVSSLTGNDAVAVSPDAGGNIDVLGGSNINTAGTPNTLTINLDDNVDIVGTLDVTSTVTLDDLSRGVVQSSATGVLSSSEGTDGQLLISSDAGAPAWANITSTGGTVTVSDGNNSINLEVAGKEVVTVNTSDDTPTTLASKAVPADTVLVIDGIVLAIESLATDDAGSARVTGSAVNDGGITTLVMNSINFVESDASSELAVNFVVSGSNLVLQVTGDSIAQYNWKGIIETNTLTAVAP